MNTLSEIAKILLQKDNFIIIPHRNPDGDCLGSSVALVTALRNIGKTLKKEVETLLRIMNRR